jgi:glycosyltransferase involved in cell wall biosynthesis
MFSAGYDASLSRITNRIDLRAHAMRIARGAVRRIARRSSRLERLLQRLRRSAAASIPRAVAPPRAEDFAHLLAVPADAPPRRARPRVVLSIGSLSAGGAERQLAAFAAARATRDAVEPIVLLVHEPEGHYGHYAPMVREAGVPILAAGTKVDEAVLARLRADRALADRLASLPSYLRPYVVEMAGEFLSLRPDCVHAWLDHQNVWSGVAALAAGVPHVVLSTRNVNPSNFPYLDQPWFREWYRLLASSPRVTLLNNSRAGAADYADWMGVPHDRFRVVLNGIDPAWIRRPEPEAVRALRAGLARGRRLVVGGVFRLSEEKQPLAWLETVRRVARAHPDAAFFHAGEGMLADRFAATARDLVEAGTLRILGRRDDVPALLAASDALLHAAKHEGTPNVLLEAAHLGCPVVATTAGGSPDAVAEGATGLLCDPADHDALATNLDRVLGDDALRARLAAAGPRWIAERFSLDRMVAETLACYPFPR